MPKHSRKRGTLPLSELPNMGGDIATYIRIECHDVCDEGTIKDLKQLQRVTGDLSECISLLKQQTRLLYGRFGFGRGVSFDVDEGGDDGHLQLDLLAT